MPTLNKCIINKYSNLIEKLNSKDKKTLKFKYHSSILYEVNVRLYQLMEDLVLNLTIKYYNNVT